MKTSHLITKIFIPILLAVISAAVTIYLSVERRPAELVLERIFLGRDSTDITEYGAWRLIELPQVDYERLRKTRPHPERVKKNGYLDDCFDEQAPWNTVIPCWHLCGPSYLLNTDSSLSSNSIGVAVYYPHWDFKKEVYADIEKYLQYARVPEKFVNGWIRWWSTSGEVAKKYALIDHLRIGGIVPMGPILLVGLRNTGGIDATIYDIRSEKIFSRGGDAGAGGARLSPVNKRFSLTITHEADTQVTLPSPIVLEPGDTMLLEFVLLVEDATQGDGPGEILFKILVNYFNGEKNADLFLGNFLMADDVEAMSCP